MKTTTTTSTVGGSPTYEAKKYKLEDALFNDGGKLSDVTGSETSDGVVAALKGVFTVAPVAGDSPP